MKDVKIVLGADHAGFAMKEKIKFFLLKRGYVVEDAGAFSLKKDDDYPLYAFAVAEKVANSKNARGILVCHTGTGMAIAENKVKGIRSAEAYDLYSAKMSRLDNDANVLSLHAHKFSLQQMIHIISLWLSTPFSGEKRHIRRIKKISAYEGR